MRTKICVVSYKRPDNNTCKLLLNSKIKDWFVYIYEFDPYYDEYIKNYGSHIRKIVEFKKPSLSKKRQLVLTDAIIEKYTHCIMMDDDIYCMKNLKYNKELSIDEFIDSLLQYAKINTKYVALSACYNKSKENIEIEEYKNICNNSIFNLDLLKTSNVLYNNDSKCEDMEFTIDLLLDGYITGRLNYLLGKNQLQGGSTDNGLSYRFNNTNRFIEEGSYMSNRYPELTDVFEYDEKHFKLNTEKLKQYLLFR